MLYAPPTPSSPKRVTRTALRISTFALTVLVALTALTGTALAEDSTSQLKSMTRHIVTQGINKVSRAHDVLEVASNCTHGAGQCAKYTAKVVTISDATAIAMSPAVAIASASTLPGVKLASTAIASSRWTTVAVAGTSIPASTARYVVTTDCLGTRWIAEAGGIIKLLTSLITITEVMVDRFVPPVLIDTWADMVAPRLISELIH